MKYNNLAYVFGLSENALSVSRSLARNNVKVIGISHYKEIGSYSRYNSSYILPHPIDEEKNFKNELYKLLSKQNDKPVIFLTSDEYLTFYTKNEKFIKENFIFTISQASLIKDITNKYNLYMIAKKNNIYTPTTFLINNYNQISTLIDSDIKYPLFIKGNDVNQWRNNINSNLKGYVVENKDQAKQKIVDLLNLNVELIVQEVVLGPDENNFKGCVYYNTEHKCMLFFSLQKLHHNPIHYGIGSLVISKKYPDLEIITKKLFNAIKYVGVGSVEFKLDERDGKLKLIEINPRYWQQNSLADFCGINFPFYDYSYSLGSQLDSKSDFHEGYKWINLHLDFYSYLEYSREKTLGFYSWIKSLRGKKIISYVDMSDPIPMFIHFYRIIKKGLYSIIK